MKEDFVIYNPERKLFAMYDYGEYAGWKFTSNVLEAFAAPSREDANKWIHGWTLPTGRVIRRADKQLEDCVVLSRKLSVQVEGL